MISDVLESYNCGEKIFGVVKTISIAHTQALWKVERFFCKQIKRDLTQH